MTEDQQADNGLFITLVEQDRSERRRYRIYAGGEEPILFVHEDLLIRYRLLKGQFVDPALLPVIQEEDDRHRAYTLACVYLGAKPRTSKQIEQYLRRKELGESHIAYALQRLETEHYVDDEEYARQFAKQRIRTAQKGSRLVKQELQQRGISRQAAEEAVNAIDAGAELAAAKAAAAKRWRGLKGELPDRKRKLTAFLMRRGFAGDLIREAVRSAAADGIDSDEDAEDGLMLDN
ncbi:RecX family transcriptional regulator [Paenibacillus protaetiae]|uniref:Regulatory protein RecX n=1 Tax=Paenibacillus protaetiae TaxID=2509456 RepID=A0A4P6ERW5_9BACL|nr:RecX family transcriptional regulator [Paenibacillus protaetiae]QAY65662.1 RecX family transcriptional regulator [Paenibacillus protaetiae]